MPRGLGPRPGSGARLLGVLAGVGLFAALVVTGRVLSGGLGSTAPPTGTTAAPAPYRVGERLACPHTHPVLATADGRSYPRGHPARPGPGAEPVACFETAAAAAGAGYPEAPLPAGAVEVDGVYLVPVPEGVRRQCLRAAGRLGFPVPCPTLRPVPSRGAPPPTVCPPPCGQPGFGFLLEDSGFVVPSGYVGGYRDVGRRLLIAAARRPEAGAVACPGARPLARAPVRGREGSLLQCPPDPADYTPHYDALLLRWRERGTVVAVSVTGRSSERRLLLALAARLELVGPPGR